MGFLGFFLYLQKAGKNFRVFSNPVASRAKDITEILKALLEQDYMKY